MSVFRSCLKVVAVGALLLTQFQSLTAQELPEGYAFNALPGGTYNSVPTVYAVHDADDVVYVSGSFGAIYNTDAQWLPGSAGIVYWDKSLARWYALGGGVSNPVYAIAAARDGSIYIGGAFDSVRQADGSTLTAYGIARYRNGHWQPVAQGLDGTVYTLAIAEHADGSHTVYAGGDFLVSGSGETLNYLAQWQDEAWQMVGGGVNGSVGSLAYSAHHQGLYVGGNFAQVNAAGVAEDHARAAFLSLADGRWQGLLTPPPCTLPPVMCQVDKRSITSFQETGAGDAVYFRGVDAVYRYSWANASTEALADANHGGLALLPDQQRLLAIATTDQALSVLTLSSESRPVPSQSLGDSSQKFAALASTADGAYLGMRHTQTNLLTHLYLQDVDGDGVANEQDNCPQHANADQLLSDIEGVGLACVADYDGDGVINEQDNCPYVHNRLQRDQDGDGEGDACDLDIDGDDVANTLDAFPRIASEWQDSDGDSVPERLDNCPAVANYEQSDEDADGLGDACDDDIDGDGVLNSDDANPYDPDSWFSRVLGETKTGDSAGQGFGQVLVALGDIDGDEVGDYAVGSPNFTAQVIMAGKRKKMARAGRVQVFSGIDDSLLFEHQGDEKGALLGSAIAAADINGDEQLDLVLGAPGINKKTGAALICLLERAGEEYHCADERVLAGTERGDLFGSSVATGDLDNSGNLTLFVSATRATNHGVLSSENYRAAAGAARFNKRVGAVYVFVGAALVQAETQPQQILYGNGVNGEFGASLAWLAFTRELLIGAPMANEKRGSVLIWQPATDAYHLLSGAGGRYGQTIVASQPFEQWQYFAIGAPQATVDRESEGGEVCLGKRLVDNMSFTRCLTGEQPGERFGAALTFVQPDARGELTLAVGSPRAKNKHGQRVGRVQVLTLEPYLQRYSEVYGLRAGALFGGALAATDLTGDNYADVLIGVAKQPHPHSKKHKAAGGVHFFTFKDFLFSEP